jgi:hypothetical protein
MKMRGTIRKAIQNSNPPVTVLKKNTVIRGKNINPKRNMSPWTSQKLISVPLFLAPRVRQRPLPWFNGRLHHLTSKSDVLRITGEKQMGDAMNLIALGRVACIWSALLAMCKILAPTLTPQLPHGEYKSQRGIELRAAMHRTCGLGAKV